ncbi:hypothetical protein LCR01_14050 [Companilactobacillus crustorum]|uniref:Uncharacterized protein n=2 Tax=Companilactobacillus crustorum TaxID=392416 RepID=A0A837RG32_9LACO|nr:hypothetical protein BI355_1389 [Companilactobacillus crustorum]KRK41731.1 hypothetical protein FD26_GL001227 [Companilactobacillus crustorum JCM 15951]KRO20489.1 hypothetical protein IV63_GL000513 [Companilactobacillus crustorum]GEO76962.1 hypothetical protein LCR01_14050 [Companilactobacillus crustorum]
MDIFKFNKSILVGAIVIFILGLILFFISFGMLDFNLDKLISHFGTWYAPINWA